MQSGRSRLGFQPSADDAATLRPHFTAYPCSETSPESSFRATTTLPAFGTIMQHAAAAAKRQAVTNASYVSRSRLVMGASAHIARDPVQILPAARNVRCAAGAMLTT